MFVKQFAPGLRAFDSVRGFDLQQTLRHCDVTTLDGHMEGRAS